MSLYRKKEIEVVVHTTAGSEFHILGAATENMRLPVDVLVLEIKEQNFEMIWLMSDASEV